MERLLSVSAVNLCEFVSSRKNSRQRSARVGIGAMVLIAVSLVAVGAARAEEVLPNQDQALARALVNHPDIVAAKAKVALAEAELYGKRTEVSRQIFELYGSLKMLDAQIGAAKASLSRSNAEFEKEKKLATTGVGAQSTSDKLVAEVQAAEAQLVRTTAQREQAEKELRLLIGSATTAADAGSANKAAAANRQTPQGPIVDKMRAALEAPTHLEFVDTPLADIMNVLSNNKSDVKFSLQGRELDSVGISSDAPITISTNQVRLRDALQAFEDAHSDLQFVLRDYGVLLTTRDGAREHGYTPVLEMGKESANSAKSR